MRPEIVFLKDPEEKSNACRGIIGLLPDWFGMPDSNQNYIDEIADKDVFAAVHDGKSIGLLALKYHFNYTAEIWWMGIKPEFHGKGIGSSLFCSAKRLASEKGCKYMAVNTLSGRSDDEFYARTRAFYKKMGFSEFVEYNEKDPINPMIWMIMAL
jgi:GNAT superfamily N-acetyltransferase